MMLQLNPSIPVQTPKGAGVAIFLIDYSQEHDLYWTVFLNENRESWTFSNKENRAQENITMGRKLVTPNQSDSPSIQIARVAPNST